MLSGRSANFFRELNIVFGLHSKILPQPAIKSVSPVQRAGGWSTSVEGI